MDVSPRDPILILTSHFKYPITLGARLLDQDQIVTFCFLTMTMSASRILTYPTNTSPSLPLSYLIGLSPASHVTTSTFYPDVLLMDFPSSSSSFLSD